jgi:hypothetical protein
MTVQGVTASSKGSHALPYLPTFERPRLSLFFERQRSLMKIFR